MRVVIKRDFPRDYANGELYEVLDVAGHKFEIYCGYPDELAEKNDMAMPLYPDFAKDPKYDPDGYPLTVGSDDACEHHIHKKNTDTGEEFMCCLFCELMHRDDREFIGVCKCEERRIKMENGGESK